MKVIALELGYDNVTLRNPGDQFEVPEEVFKEGTKFWFEPVDEADKAKVAKLRKEAKAPEVPAIDPAKQAAAHDASIKALNEKHASEVKALREELEALQQKQKTK